MLSIKTKNKNLIIPENIKIAISEINPLFSLDKGSSSLNFVLPSINKKILGPLHKTSVKVNSVDCEIAFKSFKKDARLNFSELSKSQYTCNIALDFFSFYQKTKNNNIRDLSLGGNRLITFSENYNKKSIENDFITCQVKNINFMDGTAFEEIWKSDIQCQNKTNCFSEEDNYLLGTPFIYLCYLYEQIFIENGYSVSFNFLRNDPKLNKIILYSNVGLIFSENSVNVPVDIAKVLPDLTYIDFITEIANALNVYPLINERNKTVKIIHKDAILKSHEIIDISNFVDDDMVKIVEDKMNNFSFNIKNSGIDDLQKPFLILSEQKGNVIKSSVATIHELPIPATLKDVRLVEDINLYYRYELNSENLRLWVPYTVDIQPFLLNTDKKIYEQKSELTAILKRPLIFYNSSSLSCICPYPETAQEFVGLEPCAITYKGIIFDKINSLTNTGGFSDNGIDLGTTSYIEINETGTWKIKIKLSFLWSRLAVSTGQGKASIFMGKGDSFSLVASDDQQTLEEEFTAELTKGDLIYLAVKLEEEDYEFQYTDLTIIADTNSYFDIEILDENKVLIEGNTIYHQDETEIPFMLAFAYEGDDGWSIYPEYDNLKLKNESLFNYCWRLTANKILIANQHYKQTLRLTTKILNENYQDKIFKIGNALFFIENLNYNLESDQITYNKSELRSI